jgi:hypothetical protein
MTSTTGASSTGCGFGAAVGSVALVAVRMTAPGAAGDDPTMWALSASKPKVKAVPTARKYFRINIVAPGATGMAASRISRAERDEGSGAADARQGL